MSERRKFLYAAWGYVSSRHVLNGLMANKSADSYKAWKAATTKELVPEIQSEGALSEYSDSQSTPDT